MYVFTIISVYLSVISILHIWDFLNAKPLSTKRAPHVGCVLFAYVMIVLVQVSHADVDSQYSHMEKIQMIYFTDKMVECKSSNNNHKK
jgi:hypothetical protein